MIKREIYLELRQDTGNLTGVRETLTVSRGNLGDSSRNIVQKEIHNFCNLYVSFNKYNFILEDSTISNTDNVLQKLLYWYPL